MEKTAADFYRDAIATLAEAEYILFGHDDHFVHLGGNLTNEEAERFEAHMQEQRKVLEGYLARAEGE